jgi:glycosyltransferase involved in cell wall biosynthesis
MTSQFVFVLSARYPTEKAYGVTVGRTCQAIRSLGQTASIFAPNVNSQKQDNFGNHLSTVLFENEKIKKLFNYSVRNSLAFVLWQIFLGYFIVRRFRQYTNTFCYREVYVALLPCLFLRKAKHVVEIHHSLDTLRSLIIRLVLLSRNVRIVYISERLQNTNLSEKLNRNSKVIEMGVPGHFFNSYNKQKAATNSICFLGKGESNGNSNGIEEFVNQLSELHFEDALHVAFIGLQNDELENRIEEVLSLNNSIHLSIVDHVAHESVSKLLNSFKVGLIPYPDTSYHRDRFPIKILEYAALGLNILITDTEAHRAIVPKRCAFFYNPRSKESLGQAIRELSNTRIAKLKRDNAFTWAKAFTYEERARKYLYLFNYPDS